MQLSTESRNDMVNAATTLTDGGSIVIYDGVPPGVSQPVVGTLLGTLTIGTPGFAAAANGTALANAITGDTAADATGTASYYRVLDSLGAALHEGSISVTAGTGDMRLVDTAIQIGEPIEVSSWTLTQPAGTPS